MANKKALRILVVGAAWPPETFLMRLVNGLLEAGIQLTIASSQKPNPRAFSNSNWRWLSAPSWDGPVIPRFVKLAGMILTSMLHSPSYLRKVYKESKASASWHRCISTVNRLLPYSRKQWDLIYFPWNTAAISHSLLFDTGCPVVLSCRGSQVNIAPYNPNRKDVSNRLAETFRNAAVVHCVSEAIKNEAAQFGLDTQKSVVIRPAVDSNFFKPGSRQPDTVGTFRIVTTGSLIWRKAYEYALLAVKGLVEKGVPVTFEIIGGGPERSRILYTMQDLGLEENVHLLGKLPPEKVRERLQQSHVFLLSSVSEGISNAVLEAMSCGLPVVVTDCGGMREAVTDGVEGFVVPVRDPQRMADALLCLFQDAELRAKMGQAARQRIIKDFQLKDQVQSFLALYESLSNQTR